jgi:P27 family predicted phage terminase small subunit
VARPGPAKKPPLQVVREGNPGKRPVQEGVKLPPVAAFPEPDWSVYFPETNDPEAIEDAELRLLGVWAASGAKRSKERAAAEWRRVVPPLSRSVGLADVDWTTVADYCVTVARLEECERRISVEGLIVMGQRGTCRNPLTSVAAQYRTQLKTYIGELGLSPSARGSMTTREPDGSDDDPFD